MEALSPVAQRFILHWGEMGTRWGINRTVAQIHALLYLSPEPLSAEEVATTLSVARSNVSNSLKELQGWGVVRTVHELGDRKDRFESLKDVWEMFSIILEERKRREIDPTLQMLRSCAGELEEDGTEKYTRKRVDSDWDERRRRNSEWSRRVKDQDQHRQEKNACATRNSLCKCGTGILDCVVL